jgi:UDP-glucose 4-epimerase
MKVLVTGGSGFIGSHLVDKLVKEGHDVYSLDDYSGTAGRYENPDATYFMADCRDKDKLASFFRRVKPEVVYHLAANAAENKAQFSPIDITSRNYDAFIKVLTPFIVNGGTRFIFTSSIAVYGSLQTPFKETDEPRPEDLYGISKLAAEQSLKVMSEVHGFEYVIARPHNVYGPRQYMRDPYRNVVTIWMNAILRKQPWYIYGDGEQTRCFSYIDDVIDALSRCIDAPSGSIFNIGSDNMYSVNELASHVKSVTGTSSEVTYLPERPQEVKEAISDHTQAKIMLNFQDKTPLHEGLYATWEYAKELGPQEPVYTTLEIMSPKVPKNWLIK